MEKILPENPIEIKNVVPSKVDVEGKPLPHFGKRRKKRKRVKHEKVDWDSHVPRIILYADIMGFKAKLARSKHEDVVKELRDFVVAVSKHLSPYQSTEHLRMTLFSDLIVIATDCASLGNFQLIVKAAAALLHECHKFEYPINGCIACGPLAFDEAETKVTVSNTKGEITQEKTQGRKGQYMPLFVGQSVVNAYLLNEDMFFYGIVLHPTAEALFEKSKREGLENSLHFYKLPVPLKSGGYAHLHYLDWPEIKLANNEFTQQDIHDYLLDLEQETGVRPRAYIYNTIKLLDAIEGIKSQKKE